MKKIKINYIQLSLLVLIPSIITFIIGGSLVYSRLHNTGKVTTTNNKYVNEFISTYNKLLDEYYEDLDENKLIDAAINGMMSYAGDDYTIYMNEDATDALNDKLEGTYEGIGVTISTNEQNQIYVYNVLDNSPAKNVGIEINDIIKSINGTSVEGLTTEEASNIIKNSKDAKINIIVLRNGAELSFDLERKTLIVPAITSSIKEINGKKIGYL